MEQTVTCPKCNIPVLANFYFCPNCGKQLRPKAIDVSVIKQIGVYLLSFLLPPLGLYPAIRYIRQPKNSTKVIGWVAVVLTIISYVLTIYTFIGFMQQFSAVYTQLAPQLRY